MKYIGQHIFDYVASFRQNVGIGTDTPSQKLEVLDGFISSGGSGTSHGFELKRDSLNTYQIRHLDGGLTIFNQTDSRKEMSFDGAGNVGIGIESPVSLLHIKEDTSNTNSSVGLTIENDGAGDALAQFLLTGTKRWVVGIDNSDNNKFKIAGSIDLASASAFEIDTNGNVTIPNNLTVSGTTTTINTANLNVEDKNITINYSTGDSSSTADGAGITIQDAVDSSTDATILWDATTDRFDFSNDIQLPDNKILNLGSGSADLQLLHDGNNSHVVNYTGDLKFTNNANDKDVIFNCDDGSGGNTEYFRLDGGTETNIFTRPSTFNNTVVVGSQELKFADSGIIKLGDSNDLKIQHNGTNSVIANDAGNNLIFQQNVDDGDMNFQCDDGSGGTTTYFQLDGNIGYNRFYKHARFEDNIEARFGVGNDMKIYHNGSHSYIENHTGNLAITNTTDDGDIIFSSDNGSGGTTEYFRLDGSTTSGGSVYTVWPDNSIAAFGSSADLRIEHTGSTASIFNTTGHLQIINYADDSDIIFRTDDGSGGDTEYMRLDGGTETVEVAKATNFASAVTINNNLLVGVTSGSTARLQSIAADGNSSSLRIGRADNSSFWEFNHAGNDLRIYNQASSGSDILLCVDPSGSVQANKVGIGTAVPGHLLHVQGAAMFASPVHVGSVTNAVISGSGDLFLHGTKLAVTAAGRVGVGITPAVSKFQVSQDGGHTSGNISISHSAIDIFNPHANDVDEKGSILTFSDNYFDNSGANRTIRAAIKGGTDTTGNTADGFLAFYTDSSTADSATERARINKDGNFSVHSTEQSYATGTSNSGAVDGLTGAINTLGGLSVKRGGFFGGSLFVKGMTQTSRAIEVRPSTTGNGSTFFPAMIGRNNDNGTANYLLVGGMEWAFGLFDSNQSGGTPVDQSHMIRFRAGTASDSQPRIFVGDSGSNTTNSYIEVAGHKVGTTKAVVLLHGSDGVVGNSGSNGSDSHTWTITHGMGSSRNYKVEIIQNSGNYDTVHADITRPSDTTIVVTFSAAVANSAYKALILKCG